jgi:hypothetical protein
VTSTRSPALITVVAEPGVGKTRLVEELVGDTARVLRGHSLPYGTGVSFWALAEIVKTLAGILESDAPAVVEQKLAELVAGVADSEWVLRNVRGLAGTHVAQAPAVGGASGEPFPAWRALFEALAQERPLALVFEDVQWADDGLLDFIDHLVRWAVGAPILVIATARPELLERRPDWEQTALRLTPLSEDETAELISALSDGTLSSTEAETVAARCGGNPLYAEHCVELRGTDQAELPDTVRAILDARLDALPAAEKALLQDAAVVGHVFWPSAAGHGADDPRWRALEGRQLVRRAPSSAIAEQPEYRFAHALLRDAAYERIPRQERVDRHTRTARWIEALGRRDDHAELIAHHYRCALDLAHAAGLPVDELSVSAREAFARAGDRARSLDAFDAARRFYGEARELWPSGAERERAELLHRSAVAAYESGDDDRVWALEQARASLLAAGDRARTAAIEALLAEVRWMQGDDEGTVAHLRHARELALRLEPSAERAGVLVRGVAYDALTGAYDPARAREALELVEALGLDRLRVYLLLMIGSGRVNTGESAGVEDMERALAAAREGDWLFETCSGCINLGTLRARQGDMRGALALQLEALRVAERLAHSDNRRWSLGNAIRLWVETGEWDRAGTAADAFLAESSRAGAHYQDATAAHARALLRLARGQLEGALADHAFALERARATRDPQALCPALAVAAHVHAEIGQPTAAAAAIDELLELGRHPLTYLETELADVVWAALRIGRGEAIRAALASAPDWPAYKAARALLDGRPALAAAIFDEVGAARSAALTRLRGGVEVAGALAFFRRVGATRYLLQRGAAAR